MKKGGLVPLSGSPARSPVVLALAEGSEVACPAPWIGPLIALGSRASHYGAAHPDRQLIVAVSVPRRDFAATLIGCGWMIAAPSPQLGEPMETLRTLTRDTPVRAVTDHFVLSGSFTLLDETTSPARVRIGGSTLQANRFRAVSVLAEPTTSLRSNRPAPGSLARYVRVEESWDARLARPAADLAIVGTLSWLRADAEAVVLREGDGDVPTRIADLLLPDGHLDATSSTRLFKSAGLAEQLPLPKDIRGVVLDGASAIKYVGEIEVPVVVCVLDRSVADETAAEILIDLRNNRGEVVALGSDLRWNPPVGVEALAFTVAL